MIIPLVLPLPPPDAAPLDAVLAGTAGPLLAMVMGPMLPLNLHRVALRPPPLRNVHLGQRVKAQSVLGDRVGDALGVEQERVGGEVVDGVAGLVVVDVVRDARLAAEPRGLLLRLEGLGAGEEAARGDAVVDEGAVVGAAAELRGNVLGPLRLVVVLKVGLEDVGASGAADVEGAAVAVVDAETVVGAGDLGKENVSNS